MKKENIILIGGGGHCKSCIDVIEQENKYKILGILDKKELVGKKVLKYPIIGTDDDIYSLIKETKNFLITIGQIGLPGNRKNIYSELKKHKLILPVIKSPHAYVSKHSVINEGTIIMHYALINAGAEVGVNCIINSKALIEHDVKIGDHCHISTNSIINGGVKVGNETFIGSCAICKEYIEIPPKNFIKANSLVK